MKRVVKIVTRIFTALIILFILFAFYANHQQKQFYKSNQPSWKSSAVNLPEFDINLPGKKLATLKVENSNLILVKSNQYPSYVLLNNFKEQFELLEIYLKDINRDGYKEIIFLLENTQFSKDILVFSNLDNKIPTRYISKEAIWAGDKLLFKSAGEMYIHSCGSQYCNDTDYSWDGTKLVKGYTDTYKSM